MKNRFHIQNRYSFDYKQGMIIHFMDKELDNSHTGIVKLHRSNYVELEDGRTIDKGLIFKAKEAYVQEACGISRSNMERITNLCI